MKKFEEAELERLRYTPIIDISGQLGFKVYKEGAYHRIKGEGFNIVVNSKNQYVDNASGKKGFGAINFLKDFVGKSFIEAVNFLNGAVIEPARVEYQKNNKSFKNDLPAPVWKNQENITNYLLNNRHISIELIQDFIGKGILYPDYKNNCVFVNSEKTYAFVRGTQETRFVRSCGQMDFLKYQNTDKPETIYLFESIIDIMSYLTLYLNEKGLFVSINGAGMINKIDSLNLNLYFKVYACFDNDEQGFIFDSKVKKNCPDVIIKKSINKDFNDDLRRS